MGVESNHDVYFLRNLDLFLISEFPCQDDTYQEVPGSSISWEYPHDVNMDTVTIEVTLYNIAIYLVLN